MTINEIYIHNLHNYSYRKKHAPNKPKIYKSCMIYIRQKISSLSKRTRCKISQ